METFARYRRLLAPTAVGLLGLLALAGCAHQERDDSSADALRFSNEKPGVMQPGQKVFASAQDAAGVLKDAFQAKDRRLLIAIFGPEGKDLVFFGDRVQEERDWESFGQLMAESLRVDAEGADKAVMHIGNENWPFPIPIVKGESGWFFDTVAGRDELIDRRIGENELGAIASLRAMVAAEKEYASKDRMGDGVSQYAQHFRSSEGKKDGLYWPVAAGGALDPMGPAVAQAHAEGYGAGTSGAAGKPHPYRGYFFHILTAQGDAATGGRMSYIVDGRMTKGFAGIAWPDKWGASGVMTFIVNQDGKVYQKNLGAETADLAKAIAEYNPDKSWEEVKD